MSERTKILFAITKSNWGGAQRYVYELATALPARGFVPVVVLGGDGILKTRLEEKGIRVISIPALGRDVSLLKDLGVFLQLVKTFRRERPDIVHLNSSKIGALGGLAGRSTGVRHIIFTAHGWAFNEPRPRWQKIAIKCTYWLAMVFSSRTIAVSEAMRAQVRSFPFVQRKIVVIRNGIAPFETHPRTEARSHFSLPQDAYVIGAIAELHRIKGLDTLIDAAALMQNRENVRIIVLGEGEERNALEAHIDAHGLSDVVSLPGHVPEARQYLSAFDIATLPSRSEGLSFAILEAALAGTPIVASNVGGIPEIVEHGHSALLVPSDDPHMLAAAYERLMNEPELATKLGGGSRERVIEHFSLERMIDRTVALYETLLK